MQLNYHILPNSVVINFDGRTLPIAKGDPRYDGVIKAIKEDKLDTIPDLVDNTKFLASIGNGLEFKDGLILLDGEQMPDAISNRIFDFKAQELPYSYLIKFARKLKLNPSFNSRAQLYKFLEHNGHPITPDGNFIAYRGITSDFKDCHTGTFDNSVGQTVSVARESVDDNPNNTCSTGLHVASYEYAKGFGSVTVEVEVDPKDVVAVPTDYNGTKMRVSRFKVVNLCLGIRNEAAYTDSEHLHKSEETEETTNPTYTLRFKYKSSLIETADYDPENKTLDVLLFTGDNYIYDGVDETTVLDWEKAKSPGAFFTTEISHVFDFNKIN